MREEDRDAAFLFSGKGVANRKQNPGKCSDIHCVVILSGRRESKDLRTDELVRRMILRDSAALRSG